MDFRTLYRLARESIKIDGRTREARQLRARSMAAINAFSFGDVLALTDDRMPRNEVAFVNPTTNEVVRIVNLSNP